MDLAPEVAEKLEALCRENLARELGDSSVIGPNVIEQTQASDRSTIHINVVYDVTSDRPDEEKAAAALKAAVDQMPELRRGPPIAYSFVSEREYPAFLVERDRPTGETTLT